MTTTENQTGDFKTTVTIEPPQLLELNKKLNESSNNLIDLVDSVTELMEEIEITLQELQEEKETNKKLLKEYNTLKEELEEEGKKFSTSCNQSKI